MIEPLIGFALGLAGLTAGVLVSRRARRRQVDQSQPVAPPYGTEWRIGRRLARSHTFEVQLVDTTQRVVVARAEVAYLDEIRGASKRLVRAYERGLPW